MASKYPESSPGSSPPEPTKLSAIKDGLNRHSLGNHYGSNPILFEPDLTTTEPVKLRPKKDGFNLDRSDFRRHSYGPRGSKPSPLVTGLTKGYEQMEVDKKKPGAGCKKHKPHFEKEEPLWKSLFNERSSGGGEGGEGAGYTGPGRHHTQPITPMERNDAEEISTPASSIKDRMMALKHNGEEGWKKDQVVKMRNKPVGRGDERPVSLVDRYSKLEEAQEGWRGKVEEKDVKKFTLAEKMAAEGLTPRTLESRDPDRKRRVPKMPLNRAQSSPNLPVDSIFTSTSEPENNEAGERKSVEVPVIDDEETFQKFFERSVADRNALEKIDVNLDDIVVHDDNILKSARRLRPQRNTAGSRNPLKKLMRRVDLQTEYTEVKNEVVALETERLEKERVAGKQVEIAEECKAGLQKKLDLSNLTLQKKLKPDGDLLRPYKNPMLIQVKGRRHCQMRLVEPVASSLNSGDCFLLVTRDSMFVWMGTYANIIEKAKAMELAKMFVVKKMNGYRGAAPPIMVDEDKPSTAHNAKKFWAALKSEGPYQKAGPEDEDLLYEQYLEETNMVYRLEEESLNPVEEYWGQPLKYELLKPDQCFVFDFGAELYIWTGKHFPNDQRPLVKRLARELWERGYDYSDCDINPLCPLKSEEDALPVSSTTRPDWCLFGKQSHNMETLLFKEKFIDWPDSSRLIKMKPDDDEKKGDSLDLQPYDPQLMLPPYDNPVTEVMDGENVGRGKKWETYDGVKRVREIVTKRVCMYRILDTDVCLMDPESHGQFHEGNAYIIQWNYEIGQSNIGRLKDAKPSALNSKGGKEKTAFFFWQGRLSPVTEQGASALMTVELDEERGPQLRVVQGKEPACFVQLFNGTMMTHRGKREELEETTTKPTHKLYIVKNELQNETHLVEVECHASSLRSRSSFILIDTTHASAFIWHGAKTTQQIRTRTKEVIENLQKKCAPEVALSKPALKVVVELEEGAEKGAFWEALGVGSNPKEAKTLYHSLATVRGAIKNTPRLFHLTSVSGEFEAVEVVNPTRNYEKDCPVPFPVLQSDLYIPGQPALFLVDNDTEVYLWQGWTPAEKEGNEKAGSNKGRFVQERICAMKTTINYCKAKNPERPAPSYIVFAGMEPLQFTNIFPFWEEQPEVKEIQEQEGRDKEHMLPVDKLLHQLTETRYSFDRLLERPLPEGVDPQKLEVFLLEDEFEDVLAMSREDFNELPAWKQNNVKRDAGLF